MLDLLELTTDEAALDLLELTAAEDAVPDLLELTATEDATLDRLELTAADDAVLLATLDRLELAATELALEAPFLIQSLTHKPDAEICESGQLPFVLAPETKAADVSDLSQRDQLHQVILLASHQFIQLVASLK